MVADVVLANMTDFFGTNLIGGLFGSPDIFAVFFLAVLIFYLMRAGIEFDGLITILTFIIFIFFFLGVWTILFVPMLMGMLFLIGLAILKVLKR